MPIFFIACLCLLWITIGASIISRINRRDFVSMHEDEFLTNNYQDDGEFKKLLHSEGGFAVIVIMLLTAVGWPAILYMLIRDGKQ